MNGVVSAISQYGQTIYIAGAFTSVGPATGGGVPVDAGTGAPARNFPHVAGQVLAVASDTRGGWYIGGNFTAVGGVGRRNLAHIDAGGEVDEWDPSPDGPVLVLVLDGPQLYVGGAFGTIAGTHRANLAAIDTQSMTLEAWAPRPDGVVRTIGLTPESIYIGGEFGTVDGQPRSFLAAVDRQNGRARNWSPSPDDAVWNLAVTRTTVYAAGMFIHMGGTPRFNVAAVSRSTGQATQWNPTPTGPSSMFDGIPQVTVVTCVGEGQVLLGGKFTALGAVPRAGLAIVDACAGTPLAWNAQVGAPAASPRIDALYVDGSTAYIGGYFDHLGGVARSNCAAVDLRTGRATEWNPRADDLVLAIAAGPSGLYVGGSFTSLHDWVSRSGLAALDLRTGSATPWAPAIEGYEVGAVATDGKVVYIGGDFWRVGGAGRAGAAAVDVASGLPTAWDPQLDGAVRSLVLTGDRIYLGGFFTHVQGVSRRYAAAVDRTIGSPLPWNPSPSAGVLGLLASEDRVYVSGLFLQIGGVARTCLAAVDTSTGITSAWNPEPDNAVLAMCMSGDSLIVGGVFSQVGLNARPALAAIDTATALARPWAPQVQGTPYPEVDALASLDGMVVAGGGFSRVGSSNRPFLAAFGASGEPLGWVPELDGAVFALAPVGGRIYLGGRFHRVGADPSPGIGSLAEPAGAPIAWRWQPNRSVGIPLIRGVYPTPAREAATVRFELDQPGTVHADLFDIQGRRLSTVLDWQREAAGPHEVAIPTAQLPAGEYLFRVASVRGGDVTRIVVLR